MDRIDEVLKKLDEIGRDVSDIKNRTTAVETVIETVKPAEKLEKLEERLRSVENFRAAALAYGGIAGAVFGALIATVVEIVLKR